MAKLMFFLHGVSERNADYGDPLPKLIQESLAERKKPIPYIFKGFWGNFLGENEKLWMGIDQEFAEKKHQDSTFNEAESFKYKELRKGGFAKFVGDAFSYLNSNTGSQIRQLIATQLKEVLTFYPDTTEIYFIAHSLGTAILWDTLFANRFPPDDAALTIRSLLMTKIALKGIVTMGSPIPFVNMTLGITVSDVAENLSHYKKQSNEPLVWLNFLQASDVIAYPLRPILKKIDQELMTIEDIYMTNDVNSLETKTRDLMQSGVAQFLVNIKPELKSAISSIPAVVGTPTGHISYWEESFIAGRIAEILYPPKKVIKSNLDEIIERILAIPGMTNVKYDLPDLNSQIVTEFHFKDDSGSLIMSKNMVLVHHVKITNSLGEIVYFGYVGWLDVNTLSSEILAMETEFGLAKK